MAPISFKELPSPLISSREEWRAQETRLVLTVVLVEVVIVRLRGQIHVHYQEGLVFFVLASQKLV